MLITLPSIEMRSGMPKEVVFGRSDGTDIPLVPEPYCAFCSKPVPDEYADWKHCYDCNRLVNEKMKAATGEGRLLFSPRPYDFLQAAAAGLYITGGKGDLVNREIWTLKNSVKGAKSIAPLLAETLEHVIRTRYPSMLKADTIVPVPPGDKSRGFNQSAILARELQRRFPGMEYLDVLETTPDCRSQQQTESADERWLNPRGKILTASQAEEEIGGRRVLLIDDTLVMCATTDECARVLMAAGVSGVYVAVVGRAISLRELEFIGYTGRY